MKIVLFNLRITVHCIGVLISQFIHHANLSSMYNKVPIENHEDNLKRNGYACFYNFKGDRNPDDKYVL